MAINSTNRVELDTICNATNLPAGVTCDDDFHIAELSFSSTNMTGTIPESIVNLTHLIKVQLYFQLGIGGVMPNVLFTSMPSLEWLEMFAVGFDYASFPDNINLPNCFLLELELYTNLTGTIPDSICSLGSNFINNNPNQTFSIIAISHTSQLTGTIPLCLYKFLFNPGVSGILIWME